MQRHRHVKHRAVAAGRHSRSRPLLERSHDPLFHAHSRWDQRTARSEGSEYSSLRAVREAAMLAVRDLIGGDVARGVLDLRSRVDAENAAGFVVYSLPFRDAVTIVADS